VWIRTGVFIGRPKAGHDDEFRRLVNTELAAALRMLPGVRHVDMLWARRLDEGTAPIVCQIVMHFDNRAAIDTMMASPERATMRSNAAKILDMFDGRLLHVDYEVFNSAELTP
jgi:antibiotic biosynthesis monooxygenase (ABM) superfamily enzyme